MSKEQDNDFLSVSGHTAISCDHLVGTEGNCSIENNNKNHARSNIMVNQSVSNISNLDTYYQGLFGTDEQTAETYENIPDGKYTVSVEKTCMETTTNGYLQLVWELKILSGKYKDRVIEHRNTIVESVKAMQQLKRDITFFGSSMNGLGDFDKQKFHDQFSGKQLEIALQNKEISYNTYFLKLK